MRERVHSSKMRNFFIKLPPELLAEVLARLPAKTLLQLRCVCKKWRSLIDSPYFISFNLSLCSNHHVQNNRLFLIQSVDYKRRCFTRCSDDAFSSNCQVDLPKDYGPIWPICYANGLVVCHTYTIDTSCVLWNPSIRKSLEICPPYLPCFSDCLTGFTYVADPEWDYKLVLISFRWYTKEPFSKSPVNPLPSTVPVQIYSVKSRSWRNFHIDRQWVKGLKFNERSAFLNGAIHWLGYHDSSTVYVSCIVAVNMENEAVSCFQLPSEWITTDPHSRGSRQDLAVLGDSLVFLDMRSGCSFVWVMEQYGVGSSWVKRCTINMSFNNFILFKRNGKLLVTREQCIMEYDVRTQEIKDIAKCCHDQDSVHWVDTFVESLILLT